MLAEKNTLLGPLLPWFTGCRAGSPGHWRFWTRASISVPGAPASSLATGSQLAVLKPGVEICAPLWVAIALLCTAQPLVPRLLRSEPPVSAGDARTALTAWLSLVPTGAGPWPGEGPACAAGI